MKFQFRITAPNFLTLVSIAMLSVTTLSSSVSTLDVFEYE